MNETKNNSEMMSKGLEEDFRKGEVYYDRFYYTHNLGIANFFQG